MFIRGGVGRFTLKQVITRLSVGALLISLSDVVSVQTKTAPPAAGTQEIYTCTDAQGRQLSADRPIPECMDREQKILNPSGSLKAKLGPALTAQERAQQAAKEKLEQEEQARLNEEKRRNRALLSRYPNKASHDKERAAALAQINVVRQAATNRVEELLRQRTAMAEEMEFYKKNPDKAPLSVRLQVKDINQSLAIQIRFIADQDAELKRVNTRFDQELVRLQQLWTLQTPAPPATNRH